MTASSLNFTCPTLFPLSSVRSDSADALLTGEILLTTKPHTAWGAAVTAQMYLPLRRSAVWQQLTDYPRWVQYFPALTQSEILHSSKADTTLPKASIQKCLYQAASKNFLFFTAQVDVCLNVLETVQRRIQFSLKTGSFQDFSADLNLQDYGEGTLLTYFVEATPSIPVPSMFIQQAIQLDLPANLKNLRRVLLQNQP